MKIKILKSFSYGSVSDPKKMQAGNTQEVPDDASEQMLDPWLKMGWVEWVPEWEGE